LINYNKLLVRLAKLVSIKKNSNFIVLLINSYKTYVIINQRGYKICSLGERAKKIKFFDIIDKDIEDIIEYSNICKSFFFLIQLY